MARQDNRIKAVAATVMTLLRTYVPPQFCRAATGNAIALISIKC